MTRYSREARAQRVAELMELDNLALMQSVDRKNPEVLALVLRLNAALVQGHELHELLLAANGHTPGNQREHGATHEPPPPAYTYTRPVQEH